MCSISASRLPPRILVVDDEVPVLTLLTQALRKEGYETLSAQDGVDVVKAVQGQPLELIILDLNLPTVDGFEVCERVRKVSQVPIIIISGRNSDRDKVRAFGAGADDYITKPFSLQELIARIRAVLRRSATANGDHVLTFFRCPGMEIDFPARRVIAFGREIGTTPIEFDLLRVLTLNAGKVLTHKALLNQVWGPEYGEEREYLRVHLSHLRRKIEMDPLHPRYIQTMPRIGYRFNAPEEG